MEVSGAVDVMGESAPYLADAIEGVVRAVRAIYPGVRLNPKLGRELENLAEGTTITPDEAAARLAKRGAQSHIDTVMRRLERSPFRIKRFGVSSRAKA